MLIYTFFAKEPNDAVILQFRERAEAANWKTFDFWEKCWPGTVFLREREFDCLDEFLASVIQELMFGCQARGAIAAVGMFDGIFGDWTDLLSAKTSNYVYGFVIHRRFPVLALDDEFRNSDAWRSILASHQLERRMLPANEIDGSSRHHCDPPC
jgi:hypothetical protein